MLYAWFGLTDLLTLPSHPTFIVVPSPEDSILINESSAYPDTTCDPRAIITFLGLYVFTSISIYLLLNILMFL